MSWLIGLASAAWTLDDIDRVELSQDCGSVRAESWPSDTVELHARGMVVESEGTLVITPTGCDDTVLRVPASTELLIQTQSATVHVLGLESVQVATISGDITTRASDSVQIASVSGDIDLSMGGGTAQLMTVSGDIRAKGTTGGLTVQTTAGTVRFDGTAAGPISLTSHSGDLLVSVDNEVAISATSSKGDVRLPFDSTEEASVPVSLFTFSGDAVVETRP